MPPFVLIDGNNLAHYLFELAPLIPVAEQLDGELIEALSAWAKTQSVSVELCLDPHPAPPLGLPNLQVLVADPGRQADGLILYRVDFHSYRGDPCLVVTGDQALQREVKERGVRCLGIWQFIRPAGVSTYTFAPLRGALPVGRLNALPRDVSPDVPRDDPLHSTHPAALLRPRPPEPALLSSIHQKTLAWMEAARAQQNRPELNTHQPPGVDKVQNRPNPSARRFGINLQVWPPQRRLEFITAACCPAHRPAILSLIEPGHPVTDAEMRSCIDLLRETCGVEPDFARRGAALMDRVRLALLAAGPAGLSIAELAALTGDPPARIRQKLRPKQHPWEEIVEIQAGLD